MQAASVPLLCVRPKGAFHRPPQRPQGTIPVAPSRPARAMASVPPA